MLTIQIKADMKALRKGFDEFQRKQIPFASALACTRLAQGVVLQERAEMQRTFDSPTPFTLNSITSKAATKANPTALVYPRDIAAAYLEPYVLGGKRSLGSRIGMSVPKNVRTNQYGNLPRGKIASLKGKPGVFIGTVRFKRSGQAISGVWQRGTTTRGKRHKGGGEYGTRGKNTNSIGGARTTLKLLIRFSDTTEVPRKLPFYQAAMKYLNANTQREFDAAIRQALKTAK